MKDYLLYEYAVVRWVPKVERSEFLNVGVVLFCKKNKSLIFQYHLDKARMECFFKNADLEEIEMHLKAFEKICNASNDAGLIGLQDPPSRFRWLTAKRSTVIQTSEVHPGYCKNEYEALNKIFNEMVLIV